ncbi:MAG: hypothetical protein QXN40_07550 [Candidatus Bathyarchaeia archaeon]
MPDKMLQNLEQRFKGSAKHVVEFNALSSTRLGCGLTHRSAGSIHAGLDLEHLRLQLTLN